MKDLLVIVLLFMATFFGYSQNGTAISFIQLDQRMKQEPRQVVIKIYTDWCAICKLQDRQVKKDKALQQLLASDYYYVEFNAETKEPIVFDGASYTFSPQGTGGIHNLALLLGGKQLAYPCWVLLSQDYKILLRYNGLLKGSDLQNILSAN